MPVINPANSPRLPSLGSLMNLVRAICNDSFAGFSNTPGEGQIITNEIQDTTNTNNPFTLNLLNSAIRELYRKIRITGDALLIKDNYILEDLSVVTGPLGAGVSDPTIQCWLDFAGFWNGSSYQNTLTLPQDMYLPLRMWERSSNTTDTFAPMAQTPNGLPPGYQTGCFSIWEYRDGVIYVPGATTNRDIRLRYTCLFPDFFQTSLNFDTTYVPVLDCQEFVAYRTAEKISLALGNPQITNMLKQAADGHIMDIKNERVRRMQQNNGFRRAGYNDANLGADLDLYGI